MQVEYILCRRCPKNRNVDTRKSPLYQMGKKAAELILEKIKDPVSPNHSIVLDAEIKMRASTPRLDVL